MNRFLADYLDEKRMSAFEFFRTAYIWKFGKDVYSMYDAMQYETFFTIPMYAQEYIKHIQSS